MGKLDNNFEQDFSFADVAAATVRLVDKGGQGVLVTGDIIVTAAHCINFETDGSMVLGKHFIHNIETESGKLKAVPLAVEPVSDVAFLGAPDDQVFPKEAEEFNKFCSAKKPVPLCLDEFVLDQGFRVHIYTHECKWITGTAILCKEGAEHLWIEAEEQIVGGTSGGPIVNESGELVAIASHFSVVNGVMKSSGIEPRPHLALPVWVSRDYFGLRFQT